MKFTEVCNVIHLAIRELKKQGITKQPICYMRIELYQELQAKILGEVSVTAFEFHKSHPKPALLGVPIYLVISEEAPLVHVTVL